MLLLPDPLASDTQVLEQFQQSGSWRVQNLGSLQLLILVTHRLSRGGSRRTLDCYSTQRHTKVNPLTTQIFFPYLAASTKRDSCAPTRLMVFLHFRHPACPVLGILTPARGKRIFVRAADLSPWMKIFDSAKAVLMTLQVRSGFTASRIPGGGS